MTIVSAHHTLRTVTGKSGPGLKVRAKKDAGAYATAGPITITSPSAWYGTRAGAAAGADLLRGLYLLVLQTMAEADVTVWRIDTSGRLVIGLTGHTYTIDWDHADTLLPPEYLGLVSTTTGTTTWTATTTTNHYALPYLWHAGQDAARGLSASKDKTVRLWNLETGACLRVFEGHTGSLLTVGWRGRKAAIMAIVGFLAVLFTFLGVNLLLPGLHAYSNW